MTRSQIVSRVQSRLDRIDTTAQTLIENWINEVVVDVENTYPFDYMKKRETATISADTGEFALPDDLILHHPFRIRVRDATDTDVYYHLFNMSDSFFDYLVSDASESADYPVYFIQRGGTDGLVCCVYPIQNQDLTLQIAEGYFRTAAFTIGAGGDASTNYLTDNYANLLVEGVCAKAFEHWFEPDKADRAREMYNSYMNGDRRTGIYGIIPEHKRRRYGNYRVNRIKTLDEFGQTKAIRMRRFAI